MDEDKKTKNSYQPIKDKDGNVILTSEQARNVDEDHHEFDHKPTQSEIDKANFINAKMKKLRKKSQQIKAVADLNKVINSAKGPSRKSSPINHCSSDMMHSQSWNQMRKRNKSALNMLGVPSPLNKISGPCKTAAKKKFKVWPSAYASGWGVRCTKAGGPSKFGNKSKK